ncbi:MAG: spherulation-specific family 4 protein, partial [Nitrososphaerales archaeon]
PIGPIIDNEKNTSATLSTSPYQVTLPNFNVGSGNDRLLVVGISVHDSSATSVTFGGTSLTKAISSFYNNDAELWYLTDPSGTGSIVVTIAAAASIVVGAYALSQVDQSNPIPTINTNHDTSGTLSAPSISITTANPDSAVIAVASDWGGVTLTGASSTQYWNTQISNAITGSSLSNLTTSKSAYSYSWTASSNDYWDAVAMEVQIEPGVTYTWQPLVDAIKNNPNVPIYAIVNPDSGFPGTTSCSYPNIAYTDLKNGAAALANVGITVLGYVDSRQGTMPMTDIQNNVSNYQSCIPSVTGLFLDDMTNAQSSPDYSYYNSITSYADGQGMTFVVGNPGASTVSGYIGTVSTINIYENSGMPILSSTGPLSCPVGGGASCPYTPTPNEFSYLAYDYTILPTKATISADSSYVSLLYVTDNPSLTNPWTSVSGYVGTLSYDLS